MRLGFTIALAPVMLSLAVVASAVDDRAAAPDAMAAPPNERRRQTVGFGSPFT